MAKSEFILAFNEICEEKQLDRDVIVKALESAMVSAYRKAVTASNAQAVEAKLDLDSGTFKILAEKEVVDHVENSHTEVSLIEAQKINPTAQLEDMVMVEDTPDDFGRVAAQTARQVIQQRFRDAERSDQVGHFTQQVNEIVSGVVQAVNNDGVTIGLDKKAEGTLSRKDMVRGDRFRIHDRVRALVVEVKDNPRNPQIILSRTHRDFLRRLLENEVPEIFHGIVEIRSIAREPGDRAKIAVSATQQGIDPVGACVGQRGVRIQTIVRELKDEKIDVIEWSSDPTVYISKALSPAGVVGVYLGEQNEATVIVPENQLSLAIGRDGQNARLAARLTAWRIDIKSVVEAASELIHEYENGEDYTVTRQSDGEVLHLSCDDLFSNEVDTIKAVRAILAKKAEGRAVSENEDKQLNQFVDRIEKMKASLVRAQSVADVLKLLSTKNPEPQQVLDYSITESGLSKHVCSILRNADLTTFGEIYESLKNDPDQLFKLSGLTHRDINDITRISAFTGTYANQIVVDTQVEPVVKPEEVPAEPEVPETEPEPVVAVEPEREPEPLPEVLPEIPAEPEREPSMEELFNSVDIASHSDFGDDDDIPMDIPYEKQGKKKKKKKGVQIEYDPDSDSTTVFRKHKRGDDDWGW